VNTKKHRDDSSRCEDVVRRHDVGVVVVWMQDLLRQLRCKHGRVVSDVIDDDTAGIGGVRIRQQDAIRHQPDTGESLLAPRVSDVLGQLSLAARSRQMRK